MFTISRLISGWYIGTMWPEQGEEIESLARALREWLTAHRYGVVE